MIGFHRKPDKQKGTTNQTLYECSSWNRTGAAGVLLEISEVGEHEMSRRRKGGNQFTTDDPE